jgi:CRISPR-associated protein Cas1
VANTRLLHSHRESAIVLERAKVRVDDDRVVYDEAEEGGIVRTFNVPHANVAFVLLGQGTSVTQAAMRRFADEGVVVGFTGSGGTPLLMASYDVYRPTDRLRAWLTIYQDTTRSLAAARSLQRLRISAIERHAEAVSKRFDVDDVADLGARFQRDMATATSAEELRGYEGRFCTELYAAVSKRFGIKAFKRRPRETSEKGERSSQEGRANAFLDHGNYLAYGLAAVALWAYGIPGGLSVLHGASRAGGLVFDVADTFKDAFVLPLACEGARKGWSEQEFRRTLVDALDRRAAIKLALENIDAVINEHAA